MAHCAGWTDDKLQQFLAGTFTPSDEVLQRLEKQLVEEEHNLPVSQGHGVPRRDVDFIDTLIYHAAKNNGSLSLDEATKLVCNNRDKAVEILKKACEKGLMIEPPSSAIFISGNFSSLIYRLTEEGKKAARHIN